MNEQGAPWSGQAPGPVGWTVLLAGRFAGLVVAALLLRLMLELPGSYFWWPQDGAKHVFEVAMQEQVELTLHLQQHPAAEAIRRSLAHGRTTVLHIRQRFRFRYLQEAIDTVTYTLISFMLRLVWLVAMLPLLCLCTVAGLVDGLVQRDLRRFGTGLESTFLHRHARRIGNSVATTLWVFWLAQPFFLPAKLILLPAAIGSGIIIWIVACSFKRWL